MGNPWPIAFQRFYYKVDSYKRRPTPMAHLSSRLLPEEAKEGSQIFLDKNLLYFLIQEAFKLI
jgi:hypothetical protein